MLAIGWIFLHYQSLCDEGNIYQSRGKSINRRIDEFFARACVERYSGQRPGTMKGRFTRGARSLERRAERETFDDSNRRYRFFIIDHRPADDR